MPAWSESVIRVHAIFFLLLSRVDITSANILTDIPQSNPLGIDWDPAPAPANGPPLSAGASRDRSLLPGQIGGIVGTYVFLVIVITVVVFFVGRKYRNRSISATAVRDIEMQEQYRAKAPASPPLSPLKSPRNFSRPAYPPLEKMDQTPYIFPGQVSGQAQSPDSYNSPYTPETPSALRQSRVDPRVVERDQHMAQRDLEDIYAHVMEQEDAKASGINVAELPPPPQLQGRGSSSFLPRTSSTSPKKSDKRRPSNIDTYDAGHKKTSSRSSSILSSIMSPKKSNSALSKLRISSPVASPVTFRYAEQGTEEETEPLSPRFYAPPPPPPVPKDQLPYRPTSNVSQEFASTPTKSIAEQLGPYGPGAKSVFHKHNPSQASIATSVGGHTNASTTPNSPLAPVSASSSRRALPFRQFEASTPMASKTTVLERTLPVDNGPRTGGLKTPFTANAVPYSPYQPFTPMIPITPRLVTREERKLKEKMDKKSGAKGLEMVQSEDDLWSSGY